VSPQELVARYGLLAAAFIYAFVSGIVPVLNTEIFLVAVAALASGARLAEVLVMASVGQMAAKTLFYLAGRGTLRIPLGRMQSKMDEWAVRLGRSKRGVDVVMFSSASWGVPPFLVVPYLAGTFRLSYWRFLLWGLLGRFLRFAAVVLVPVAIRALSR
jgi:membrane protein YqaA with SNARE-associated domain